MGRLLQALLVPSCHDVGHSWRFIGGRNAGCDEPGCACSVPVHSCANCTDCDYGDNAEAAQIIAECMCRRVEDMTADELRRFLDGRDDWPADKWQDHCGDIGCVTCTGVIPMDEAKAKARREALGV